MKVLMVCLGNICRSPTAEGVFRQRLAQAGIEAQTDSAGTAAYHIGNPPDPRSQAVAKDYGYPIGDLRARQVSAEDFEAFDWIFAMDQQNYQDLLAIQPANSRATLQRLLDLPGQDLGQVPDPYYGGDEGFHEVVSLIETAADAWIEQWQSKS